MTRYTNLAHKRTYLQAGLDDPQHTGGTVHQNATDNIDAPEPLDGQQPAKKKRKRGKPKHVHDARAKAAEEAEKAGKVVNDASKKLQSEKKRLKKAKFKEKQAKDAVARALASEQRRQKRIQDRNSTTICFACREHGHAARVCPKAKAVKDHAAPITGICYRCGSNKHSLSRCRKPENPENPLPFASCFVCSGTGHIASSCPKNKDKGVYPNGGSCKLCGETSHLAKDCGVRKQPTSSSTLLIGVGHEAAADEDDFHIIQRKTAEVDREEQDEARRKRLANIKAGALSGVVMSFPKHPAVASASSKKVVTF